ncbi:MAG: DUF3256 family protein [Bacteroides sp.]|nr:DUF3256 family protein [Bacteroides sp.]
MKKIFLVLFSICLGTLSYSQEAKTLFLKSPESVTPFLTSVNRADFIDFLESNMKAQVKNKFESTSEMTDLTSDYIRIQMTPQSSWEMKVLSLNDSTKIISTITVVCAPVCDSQVQFYDANWKPLEQSSFLQLPAKEDFFLPSPKDSQEEYQDLYKKADILMVKATLSKENDKIFFQYTTPEYMVKEDAEKLEKYLVPSLIYKWSGGRFMKE